MIWSLFLYKIFLSLSAVNSIDYKLIHEFNKLGVKSVLMNI